jgi:hypothetical protein
METRADQIRREGERIRAFQRRADDLARLITDTDLPWVDIEIRIGALRREAERLFPLREHIFDLIYRPRFERLRRQRREPERDGPR